MKISRTNRLYAFQGAVTTPLVLLLLVWSAQILQIFPYFSALSMLFVLMILIWQEARIPMGNAEMKRIPWPQWLVVLFSIQAGYLFLFIPLLAPLWRIQTSLSGSALPTVSSVAHQWISILQYGFPWYFAILFAVAMGYFGFIRKERPEMMSVLAPLIGKAAHTRFGALFDLNLRFSCTAIYSFFLCFIVVGVLFWLAPYLKMDFFGWMTPIQVFILVALIAFFKGPTWSRWLSHMVMQRWRINSVIFIQLVIMLLISVGLFYLFSMIFSKYMQINQPFPARFHEMIKFIPTDQAVSWLILCTSLAWVPVLGSAIVRVSRGYSLRQMILGASLFPAILLALLYSDYCSVIEQFFITMMSKPQFFILGLLYFAWLFKDNNHLNRLFYGNIGPESLGKYRSPFLFLSSSPNSVLVCLLMVYGFGYKFFALFSFYFGFIAWLMLIIISLSLSFIMLNSRQFFVRSRVS